MRLHSQILTIIFASVIVFALMIQPTVSFAKVYSWTDDQGKKHFTSDPSKVPRMYREKPKKPNFRKTGNGWECAKPIDPKTEKQLLKTESNMHLWEKEIVRNKKTIKKIEAKKEKLLGMGKPVAYEENAIRQNMERNEDLENDIKLVKKMLKIDKDKYICK